MPTTPTSLPLLKPNSASKEIAKERKEIKVTLSLCTRECVKTLIVYRFSFNYVYRGAMPQVKFAEQKSSKVRLRERERERSKLRYLYESNTQYNRLSIFKHSCSALTATPLKITEQVTQRITNEGRKTSLKIERGKH